MWVSKGFYAILCHYAVLCVFCMQWLSCRYLQYLAIIEVLSSMEDRATGNWYIMVYRYPRYIWWFTIAICCNISILVYHDIQWYICCNWFNIDHIDRGFVFVLVTKPRWLHRYHKARKLLVGGWPTPLRNMSSSDWIIIPTIGENKIPVPKHQPDTPQCSSGLKCLELQSSCRLKFKLHSSSPVSEFSEALEEVNKPENPHFLCIRPLSLLPPCRLKTSQNRTHLHEKGMKSGLKRLIWANYNNSLTWILRP